MKLSPKKSLGQNFLNNPRIPKRMADAAEVGDGDTVLEIGPGTGVLTRELLSRGARVIAVEADSRAVEMLRNTFQDEVLAQKLVIFHADARSLDLAAFDLRAHTYKVVSNIPYYLSGLLFRTFLETPIQPSTVVFLVQKEVAERITRDEKESLLSLSVEAYGTPRYIATVARGNFSPAPQVDSAILAVYDISHQKLTGLDERFFFTVLHAGFASKRKQLLGNLAKMYSRDVLVHIFSTLGLDLKIRGEDIGIEDWISLVRALTLHSAPPLKSQS